MAAETRAARLAERLPGQLFNLDWTRLGLLIEACEGHDRVMLSSDPTVGTCWDADRLDLDRVGIVPHPSYISTEAARRPGLIKAALARSGYLP